MNEIKSIALIGCGNVGWHLANALREQNIEVKFLWSRNKDNAQSLADEVKGTVIDNFSKIKNVDLILVAIVDDAIPSIVSELRNSVLQENIPIAYTSGSVELNNFEDNNELGVFYPLQTFSKNTPVNIFEVPFFIEAKSETLARKLFDLAWKVSRKVEYADSEKRAHLHLAAVFANNFSNQMYAIAEKYLVSKDIKFEHLLPLILEGTKKLKSNSPQNIQTGPAKRKDYSVIEKQKAQLTGLEKEIYTNISDYIIKNQD